MFFVSALGALGVLVSLAVLGVLAGLVSLVFWVVLLPFRILGLVFRGLAFLLFLPFLLLLGGGIAFLVGIPILLALMVAAAPAVLFVLAIVWLVRRSFRRAPA